MCLNCEQHLCVTHAVAQLTEHGHKTGKFMCQECTDAAKEHAKSLAAVAKTQEMRKLAAIDKATREALLHPPAPPKKPAAAPAAPAKPAAAEAPPEPTTLEFTPKDGKLSYTTKNKGE